ncbi:MAG: tetratricopeptide repeat protein [Planctomycetota bacterium]
MTRPIHPMSPRFQLRRAAFVAALVTLFSLSACLTPAPGHVPSPDEELARLLDELRDARGGEFATEEPGTGDGIREAQIAREIQSLALTFPRHVPVLVASASLAYERRDPVGAQKLLDQALRLDPAHVPAVLLRVRIAAEGGNLPYARRRLAEQIELTPDEPSLREANGGVLYLLGDYDEALAELDLADRFRAEGEGTWKADYHRGLIFEAQGRPDEALAFYRKSAEGNPDFASATRRLRWLEASTGQE